ncbi:MULTISPECIES: DUF916 and DUF3324 domain-containing protein [Carnobacterium]|uniref:DUF916 and DUF3324 domain-containing protein n=1 Tax=Carnobacterium TaxID=2747 RepID=UPI0028923FD4|nr:MULTISPECIES: DUF916 and DUF3324 domain-containing protein [Carnobacterium]MDT1940699.1 DUF916 and DUF3324 domain-containing protein [Carnobacterium divergens]MDT1943137.1 DUF916 and DUF3324 domain-containing protein [Carnobacterium divergens]MDT1948944.1 DUF916 and DUF3324 domain-containing protein [Carnobacterium divergens]MDT1951425.1 DUF916 and DUF3324 domain-containing protein [Carnobacterium divergens]MDT1956602.1 DUF916 and DUF3324 domain-containing protein [Carnobacterium divergens]
MKNKLSIVIIALAIISSTFSIHPKRAVADGQSDANKSEPTSISISANLPDNQINKDQSYFDLLMKLGQEQELEVVLRNSTDKDLTMIASANSAVTNDNGVVDYSFSKPKADSTLKVPLSQIAVIEKETVVPAKSDKIVKVHVKMPNEPIEGVIAGGIYLQQKEDTNQKNAGDGGVQIKNKYVYVMGIQLREKEDISQLVADMKLDKKKIKPKQVNYRNVLGINLQNTEPVYIRNLTVDAKIYKKGSQEVLHESKQESLKMAPNSNFNYGVSWENQEFKAGKYRAKVTAHSEDYNKDWSWDEEFTITKKEAEVLNKEAVELEVAPTPWWVYVLIGLGIAFLLLLILYLIKRYIDKKKEAKRKEEARARKRRRAQKEKQRAASDAKRKSKKVNE